MASGSALIEVLDTLRHDLAKYLSLPLRMLPADAADAEVRRALEQALLRTRSSKAGTQSAAALYAELRAELSNAGADAEHLSSLDVAVQRALAWQAQLTAVVTRVAQIDRAAVERDFACVSGTLDAWLDEVASE
jgi:hypothetical protein